MKSDTFSEPDTEDSALPAAGAAAAGPAAELPGAGVAVAAAITIDFNFLVQLAKKSSKANNLQRRTNTGLDI